MAEKKAAVNLPGLAASGVYGAAFTKRYEALSGHFEKRTALFDALRIGSAMREAGLLGLLPLVDNQAFADLPLKERRSAILRYVGMIIGETPAEESGEEKRPVIAAEPAPVPPAEVKPVVATPPATTTTSSDGATVKIEPQEASPKRGPLGLMQSS